MDWGKSVAAAKRNERMTIKAGGVVLAEGKSYMDGDTLCIECGPLTAKGTARYVRITVAYQDYLVAERHAAQVAPRRARQTAAKARSGDG